MRCCRAATSRSFPASSAAPGSGCRCRHDPQTPHRHRRRRAEHRPVASLDSGRRGLPRQRVRLDVGLPGGAEPRDRRRLPARPAAARWQRHRSAAAGPPVGRAIRGRDDLRPRDRGRRRRGDEDRRLRLPREAAGARPRAAGRQERARVVGPAAREPALPGARRRGAEDDWIGARCSSTPCSRRPRWRGPT